MTNKEIAKLIGLESYDDKFLRFGGTSKGAYTMLPKSCFMFVAGRLCVRTNLTSNQIRDIREIARTF